MSRPALYLALLPLVAVPATGALAATDLAEPPPATPPAAVTAEQPADPGAADATAPQDGSASATALGVGDVAAVGETGAQAGPDGSSASGNAVAVGGEPLIEGTTGGSASSDGEASGALLDTGDTELGRLALTPWEAQAASSGGESSSSASAALARLQLVDLLAVDVLQSGSEAQYGPAGSSGSSSSDGAVVDLGDGQLVVRVLHAETSSSDGGGSYVLGIGDQQLLTDEQAGGQCALEVPSLVGLSCLTAEGGAGAGDAAAEVVGVELADGALPTATVVGATSGGTGGAPTAVGGETPSTGDGTTGDGASTTRASAVPSSEGTLAFTGAHTGAIGAAAALLLALGTALVRLGRRVGPVTA